MASCKLGHVYIVHTVLTKPPKAKFALCVCAESDFFVWINTEPRKDGRDQLPLPAGCHTLVRHTSHLDLSRVVKHQPRELDEAREFECISRAVRDMIVQRVDAGLFLMPAAHAALIRHNLLTL